MTKSVWHNATRHSYYPRGRDSLSTHAGNTIPTVITSSRYVHKQIFEDLDFLTMNRDLLLSPKKRILYSLFTDIISSLVTSSLFVFVQNCNEVVRPLPFVGLTTGVDIEISAEAPPPIRAEGGPNDDDDVAAVVAVIVGVDAVVVVLPPR